jgi:short-subunit dehydrogenase involved in D-alanine esterification of teichoic acids
VARVQKLDDTLSQTSKIETNREMEQMFDVYTSIILVNDQLTLLKENTKTFPELNILINDFLIFRQVKLFLNNLPKEYENSKGFSDQFSAAAEHVKPLLHLNF